MAQPLASYKHDKTVVKYYAQARRLFALRGHDHELLITHRGWCEASLEPIANSSATMLREMLQRENKAEEPSETFLVAVDGFCGVGVNSIALAKAFDHVISIDLDADAIACTRRNTAVYGVASQVTILHGDIYSDGIASQVSSTLEALRERVAPKQVRVAAYFSPPWGGTAYMFAPYFDLYAAPAVGSICGTTTPQLARRFGAWVLCIYVPRSTLLGDFASQVAAASETECTVPCRVVSHSVNGKLKGLTLYGALGGDASPSSTAVDATDAPHVKRHRAEASGANPPSDDAEDPWRRLAWERTVGFNRRPTARHPVSGTAS